MPQRSTPDSDTLHRQENLAVQQRDQAVNAKRHLHEEMVADLMSAAEGKTLRAVAELADDYGLGTAEAIDLVEDVGDGFAPDPRDLPNANEASEDAPKR